MPSPFRNWSGAVFLSLLILFLPAARAKPPVSFEGHWSAPSLTDPATLIHFSLLPSGRATEEIGGYQGVGTWKIENGAARIQWASEWIGLLRPTARGGFELLTWKKGSPPDGPPDDTQPARRVDAPAPRP